MKQNNIPGYTLLKEEALTDVKGTGLYFKHVKSGARVCVIANDDENKVFYIAFRTTPTDSSGVAHIIEHSVLCGSEKFPVKDPFIELEKGSLNTFLNAFTYPDKTVYPVASCNDKDFANLCDVYLDAVLHPNIYKREEIFKQEGWHYELESEDADLRYNGIVYSEMKGAYSSPDDRFYRCCARSVTPDNAYGVDSGGDPACIPNLTYEQFLDFHRNYYHPANSYIYLYGNMNVEERLQWLDKAYLSEYDEITVNSQVELQKEFGEIRVCEDYYSVDAPDENGKGVFYAMNFFAGDTEDLVKGISYEVIDYVLFSAPGAPVKQALLDAGIGDDIISFYSGDRRQPTFTIGVKNAQPGKEKQFRDVVTAALEKCVRNGLKEESIRAAVNTQEFKYREADFGRLPKGLMYGLTCLSTWLYDDDMPFTTLHMNDAYAEVKSKIGTGFFEKLIEDTFLKSNHGTLFSFIPKVGMNARADEELKKKLADYKATLSKEEIKKLVADTKALKEYQSEESTAEQKATIPLLSLSDISREVRPFKYEEILKDKGRVVFTDYDTNGVCYIKLYFDCNGVKTEDAPYIGLLSDCITLVDTKQHGYQELNDLIYIYTGGMGTDVGTNGKYGESDIRPYLSVGVKTTVPEADRALGFLQEILTESVYSDEKRIKELLLMIRSNIESDLMYSGSSIAATRAGAYMSQEGCFAEATDGIEFYDFITDLTDNFESRKNQIISKLQMVSDEIIKKGNCILHITADNAGKNACESGIVKLLDSLKEGKSEKRLVFTPEKKNEGLKISGRVQYNVAAGNMYSAGYEYSGSLDVVKHMLSCGYLWNEIRVKGGAYGTNFASSFISGNVIFSSYRDPNLKNTYEVYEKVADYLEHFDCDERELTQAKIGVFGSKDTPLTPRQMGSRSFNAYIQNVTEEMLQKYRDDIFACTVEDIRKTSEIIRAVIAQDVHCTVGSAAEIDKNKDFFLATKTLI